MELPEIGENMEVVDMNFPANSDPMKFRLQPHKYHGLLKELLVKPEDGVDEDPRRSCWIEASSD